MARTSRVLAAVDFSAPARRAFDYALALSKRHGAGLVVVQAVPRGQPFSSEGRDRLALAAELRQRAKTEQVDFAHRVQHGDPAEVILLHARTLRPDLIVVGSHQRSGLDRLRAGSVGERVAAGAAAPVMVVAQEMPAEATARFRHVLVAVDFSPASERAIDRALTLASGPDDRITLLHVVAGSSSSAPPHFHRYGGAEYQAHLIRDARRRLQLAVPVEGRTAATIHTRVVVGDPATEISRAAESLDADLLVVGVPQRGMVSRALFGTTAARVLRRSRVAVMTVPDVGPTAGRAERTGAELAA